MREQLKIALESCWTRQRYSTQIRTLHRVIHDRCYASAGSDSGPVSSEFRFQSSRKEHKGNRCYDAIRPSATRLQQLNSGFIRQAIRMPQYKDAFDRRTRGRNVQHSKSQHSTVEHDVGHGEGLFSECLSIAGDKGGSG